MKYFSLFSGIGGFESGIQQVMPDAKCVGFSEIDKWAISIYQKKFKDHKNYGDATRIIPSELPDFDILVGGFPCQAFSIAGKRRGFSDKRGTLFFEIARIIREKQPRFLVLENVKGLLSHDEGRSVNSIMSTLDELGYDVQWNVCNSKNHGVPQSRQRIFFVGHLRASGQSAREIFSIQKSHGKTTGISKQENISPTLMAGHADGTRSGAYVIETQLSNIEKLGNISGGMGAKTGLYAVPVLAPDRPNKRQNGRRFKDDGDPSFTLTAQDRHGVLIDKRIRRLMPIECERLQGFSDDWTKYGTDGEKISDSQRYKCCGNAVTVNVVAAIFKKISNKEG